MDPNLNQPPIKPAPPEQFPQSKIPNEIEKTKKVSRKLLFLISFVLAILIPTGIYLYSRHKSTVTYKATLAPTPIAQSSPTPNPQPDWQAYQSSGLTNNFSVNYPPNFSVSTGSGTVTFANSTQASGSGNLSGSDIAIYFSEASSSQSFSNNPQGLANAIAGSLTNVNYTTTQIGSESGNSLSDSTFYTEGIYRNGVIFEISAKSGPDGIDSLTQIFPQVIQTFQFLSVANPSSTPISTNSAGTIQ